MKHHPAHMYVHVTLRSLLHLPNEECALSRSDQVGSTISGLWSNAPELQTGNSRGLSHYHRLLYMVSPNLHQVFPHGLRLKAFHIFAWDRAFGAELCVMVVCRRPAVADAPSSSSCVQNNAVKNAPRPPLSPPR